MTRPSDLVHVYTRSQALADGVLVDVTRQASPAEMLGGFTIPVAVTAALWVGIESIPASRQGIADVRGRLHDVLWMAACATRRTLAAAPTPRTRRGGETLRPLADSPPLAGETARTGHDGPSVHFRVILPRTGVRVRLVTLRLDLGPGDARELVATIGFPEDF